VKFILEYKSYRPKYEVGDVVLVTWWYLREEDCPKELWKQIPNVRARITEVISNRRLRISYDIEGSPLFGAPESVITNKQIISKKTNIG
jgi:hypothetical protein